MEPAGRYPYSLDFLKRSIISQNMVWPLIFGSEHYADSESALDFLILRNEEKPEFPNPPLLSPLGNGWKSAILKMSWKECEA